MRGGPYQRSGGAWSWALRNHEFGSCETMKRCAAAPALEVWETSALTWQVEVWEKNEVIPAEARFSVRQHGARRWFNSEGTEVYRETGRTHAC